MASPQQVISLLLCLPILLIGISMAQSDVTSVSDSDLQLYNEAALVEKLLKNYDSRSRPVRNISTTIFLDLSMYLVQILKLSEKEQVLLSNVWLILTWQDEFLKWNATEWGMDKIRIPAKHLWLPDLTLYNNAQEGDPIVDNMYASTAVVSFEGSVTLWPRPLILQSNCRIDVLYFPFDLQHCYLKFSSWAYSAIQVNLTSSSEGAIYLDDYIPSTEWQLESVYTEVSYITYIEGDGGYSFIKFHIRIRRKALYYVVNLIMPCLMLTLVMLFGQYLPCNSGDAKVQLGTALFTSMCVFLLLVGTMMPPSDVQPLLGLYYGVTLLLITTSTALNVLVLNVVNRDTAVPAWVRLVFLHHMARVVAPGYHRPFYPQEPPPPSSEAMMGPDKKPSLHSTPPPPPPTYDADLDIQLSPHCQCRSPGGDLKNFNYIQGTSAQHNGSAKSFIGLPQNGFNSNCKYELLSSNPLTCNTCPSDQSNIPFTAYNMQQRDQQCSLRLANQNMSNSTRYGLADSPIKELVSNAKTAKLDENGRLLFEMKTHLGEIRKTLGKISSLVNEKAEVDSVRNDWLDVGIVLDRILVILFTIFTIAMSMFVYNMYPSQLVNSLTNSDD